MTPENIIKEFDNTKALSIDTIKYINTGKSVGKELVVYFRENKNRDFALFLFEKLTELRNLPYPENYDIRIETLMQSAYLLGLHQHIEDSLKIWNTKTIDFDTYCGFDIQLVVFAGIDKTINFLKTITTDEAKDALDYIIECKKCGDFDDMEIYFSEKKFPWFV